MDDVAEITVSQNSATLLGKLDALLYEDSDEAAGKEVGILIGDDLQSECALLSGALHCILCICDFRRQNDRLHLYYFAVNFRAKELKIEAKKYDMRITRT